MSLTISNLFANSTPAQWLAILLANAATLNLPTTSWFTGDPLRTTLQILSVELAKEDAQIRIQAQGGFLDFAASGQTILTDINGNTTTIAVSPDPSVAGQNPNGNPTWLDELASSVYNVSRVKAFAATGPLYVANTTGGSLGVFQPGTLHAANSLTNATFTYSGTTSFTFAASTNLGTSVASSVASAPPVVNTTSPHGLTIGQTVVVAFTNIGVLANGVYAVFVNSATQVTVTGQIPVGAPTAAGVGRMWSTTALNFTADLVGTGSNSPPNEITTFTTSLPGAYINNPLNTLAGGNYQSNTSLAALCRAYLGALSLAGASGAYTYYALQTSNIVGGLPVNVTATNPSGIILANPMPATMTLDGGPITQAVTNINTQTGIVVVNVRNAGGAVPGCINNAIVSATAASPIVVTTSAVHGMQTGDYAQVNFAQGLAGLNGRWQVTVTGSNTFSLNGSTGTGAYTGQGTVSGGDLFAVSSVLQTYATPNAVTQITQSATPVTVNVVATVYVPKAFASTYAAAWPVALAAYFSAFPIGGLNVDNATNVLPISAIEGLLYAVGSSEGSIYTLSVNALTLNNVNADVALGTSGVAVLGTTTINVVGV